MTEENEIIDPEEIEPESTEVTVFDGGSKDLVFNSDKEMKVAIEQVGRRIDYIDQLVRMGVQKLLPKDFHDFGGKPLLQGVGAQRLIKFFGISVRNIRRIPDKGYEAIGEDTAKRLRVTYRGDFYFPGTDKSIEGEGVRDSHNQFFCKSGDDYKEIAEIELPNLDRAARTAMYRDGITTMLGLKGVTWEYLAELGFSADKTTGHNYQTGGKGGSVAGDDTETRKLLKEIGDMCLEMADGDPEKAKNALEDISKWKTKDGVWKPGKRELSQLTPKQTPIIHRKVKDRYDAFMKDRANEEADHTGTGDPPF